MQLISIGDFVDLITVVNEKGIKFIKSKFYFSRGKRMESTWQCIYNNSSDWWLIPKIRKRWNFIISGNEQVAYPDFVVEKYLNKKNNLKMLSIGCGGGTAEIAFSKHPCFETILAIDLSPKIIEHAKQKITTNDPILHFECKNFITMDLNEQKFDVIHFNSSLHHFFNIEIALNKVKKILKKDGIMIINEYVGPNRFQWTKTRLLFINKVLKEIIPQSHKYRLNNRIKKNNVYRVGWLRSVFSDPSEAIYSAQILKLIHANFTTIAEVELGGNLLHPLLKDIAHHFIEENSINSGLLQKLFLLEDQLMVSENYSDFIFGIYSK